MEHKYEKNIICPYCDHEDENSWEFQEDSAIHACGNCEKEFNVTREIEVTYTTSRIDCEENNLQHGYKFESVFMSKTEFTKKGIWIDLPENKWTYTRIMMCSICGDKEYIKITKEEYENTLAKV
jgi:transcription elongation factor Elf1